MEKGLSGPTDSSTEICFSKYLIEVWFLDFNAKRRGAKFPSVWSENPSNFWKFLKSIFLILVG